MKSSKIEVRMSDIEKQLLKILCESGKEKMTMSDYIRKLIFQDFKKVGLIGKDANMDNLS